MEAQEFAAGLRECADWVDANAEELDDIGLPDSVGPILMYALSRDDFRRIVRVVGRGEKNVEGDYFRVIRRFGAVEIEAYIGREKVCRKVVKAVRTETREIPDPAVEVPTITVQQEVEDVEWVCEPSVLAGGFDDSNDGATDLAAAGEHDWRL